MCQLSYNTKQGVTDTIELQMYPTNITTYTSDQYAEYHTNNMQQYSIATLGDVKDLTARIYHPDYNESANSTKTLSPQQNINFSDHNRKLRTPILTAFNTTTGSISLRCSGDTSKIYYRLHENTLNFDTNAE